MATVESDSVSTSSLLTEMIDQSPIRPLQVWLIGLCFCLLALDGFDVLVMAFTASEISRELSLSGKQLGVVFSSALVGMTLGAMFLGRFADIFGRRPIVILSSLLISVCMILTGFVQSLEQLVVARTITGLGIGAMLASITSSVSEFTPDRHRNFAISIVQAGYSIGAVVGGIIAALVILDYGWRSVFIGGGLLTAATSIAAIFVFPESLQFLAKRRPNKSLDKINRILKKMDHESLKALPKRVKEKQSIPKVTEMLTSGRAKPTLLLWAAFFMVYATVYFLISWMPKLLTNAGLSIENSIYVSIAMNVGGALGMILLGKLSGRFGLTRLITLYLILGTIGMLVFGYVSNSFPVMGLLVLTFITGFFVLGGFISFYSVAARLYPSEIRTTGVGWAIGLGRTGAILGPIVGGIFVSMNFTMMMSFLAFSIPLIIAAICASFIHFPKHHSS